MLIDKQGLLMQQYVGTKYLMNKYLVTVRVGGQLVKTAVFADSTIHAKLLCQYKYGMNSIAVSPVRVDEAEAEDDSTLLDSTIKPKPPATPAQARINSLKQGVERSREQLHAERERQRQQRETERKRKQQQQRF